MAHVHARVMWKATFIEVGDDERQGSLSPRPSSEPCCEAPSLRSTFFDADRMRAAALSERMEEAWASNSREAMRRLLSAAPSSESPGRAPGKAGRCDRAVRYDSESTAVGLDSLSECGSSDSAPAREAGPAATPRRDPAVALAGRRRGDAVDRKGHEKVLWKATFIEVGGDERAGSLSPRPSSEPCSEASSLRSTFFDADRTQTAALSEHMEEAWASNSRETMRASFEKRRMSAVADAIRLLPEQLSSVVQTKAESLADSVKIDLSLVQRAIRRSGGDGDVIDVAIDQLDKIPQMIRSSFDSKIVEANEAMRMKLSAIMQKFKGFAPESREVVTQLWTIPEELDQITLEAVEQAVQESQREAASCCDRVMRTLPNAAGISRQALEDVKSQIVESVPEMYSETMRALRSTANANVKHAVACVDDPKAVPVASHLVADVLLRAKMGTLPQAPGAPVCPSSHGAAGMQDCVTYGGGDGALAKHRGQWQEGFAPSADRTHPTNPGSLGHPEMCVRPCLYFLRGQCASGDACRFCHCPHPTRPVHLGRSHRKALEATTATECFGILLPALERKMITLGLATDTLQLLAGRQCAVLGGAPVDAASRVRAGQLRTLEKAMGALSMRSLLVVLQRKVGPQSSCEKALLDALILEVREAGFLVDIGEEVVQEDA